MNGPVKLAACGAAIIALLTGCASSGSPPQPTAAACATVAVSTVRQHAQLAGLPGSCRGLGAAGLDQAVRIAVGQLAWHGDKIRRRHLAGLARAHLGSLIGAAQQAETAYQARARQRAAARHCDQAARAACARTRNRARGIQLPIRLAALAAWLLTAASGAVLIAGFLPRRRGHGGTGRRRRPPPVILGHAGLAIGGLMVWTGYLLTGLRPLAWTALGLLLPVAGLGMATLVLGITGPDSPSRAPTAPATAPPAASRGAPVLLIAAHGVLATVTMLLALLGAVAAITS